MSDQDQPWWHVPPEQPPTDSVLVEGMKLAAALRDWAVDSGAAAALTDLTASVAGAAGAYLGQGADPAEDSVEEEPQPVVRCVDCPVCRGLDALDASNPQMAQTVRSAMAQVTALIDGLLPGDGQA